MSDQMKQAILECCERNCAVISPDITAFAKDLIHTLISTSENKIDDLFLGIVDKGFAILDEFLATQIEKIAEEE